MQAVVCRRHAVLEIRSPLNICFGMVFNMWIKSGCEAGEKQVLPVKLHWPNICWTNRRLQCLAEVGVCKQNVEVGGSQATCSDSHHSCSKWVRGSHVGTTSAALKRVRCSPDYPGTVYVTLLTVELCYKAASLEASCSWGNKYSKMPSRARGAVSLFAGRCFW